MATSTHTIGKGLTLKRGGSSSPQSFATISEIKSITGFGEEKPLVEVTHFQSTAREYCRAWEPTNLNPASPLEIQFTMKVTGSVAFQPGA